MIIKTVTVKHATQCDRCGAEVGWAESQAEAKALAKQQGWRLVRSWDGPSCVERDYCPPCWLEWQREGETPVAQSCGETEPHAEVKK